MAEAGKRVFPRSGRKAAGWAGHLPVWGEGGAARRSPYRAKIIFAAFSSKAARCVGTTPAAPAGAWCAGRSCAGLVNGLMKQTRRGSSALQFRSMPELMEFSWPVFLRELDAAERVWNTRDVKYPRPDAVPWMPLPIAEFVSLLYEAMTIVPFRSPYTDLPNVIEPWIPGRNWLIDVGCGPGTKLRLAHAMFGLNCFGIDIVQRFVDETQIHGIRAANIDAFDFPAGPLSTGSDRARPFGYADFDIVYVNRPSGLQDELEHLIMERMGNGAVLIAVNWRNDPGRHGFTMHFQEQGEPVRGVWIKT